MTNEPTPMRTTTLLIQKPESYALLSQHYRLERYIVPSEFYREDKHKHAKLHIQLKEQLNYPYMLFGYDRLDQSLRTVIYVLYPRNNSEIKDLTLTFLSNDSLKHREIKFDELAFHMLIKLLQNAYFRGNADTNFVAQGDCYVFAQRSKGADICLEIEIKGDRSNKETDLTQAFKIISHATRFILHDETKQIDDWQKRNYPWFQRTPRNGQMVYNQLRPAEIDNFGGQLYWIHRSSKTKPSVNFHDQSRIERGRGKILYDFTDNFIKYLDRLGIEAKHRLRHFYEHKAKSANALALDLAKMEKIYLFDNRLNKQTVSGTTYLTALKETYSLNIELLDNLDNAQTYPVLLLQDVDQEDFLEKRLLYKRDDPYKAIYHNPKYRHIPKQSINVNPNDSGDYNDLEYYLEYDSIIEEENYALRFDVCMHELYLKQFAVQNKPAFGLLPGLANEESALARYMFVRRKTDGANYTVALYIENGLLCFLDLRAPENKSIFYELVEERKIDWDAVLEELCRQQFKKNPDELVRFDIVIGDGIAIEIEDIKEHVLYDYEAIESRQYEASESRPIDDFRLAAHYDEVKNANMCTYEELNSGTAKNQTRQERSRNFLAQLQALDTFLDELAQRQSEISYNDLVSGDRLERIGKIFDLPRFKPRPEQQDSKPQEPIYNHTSFKAYYQKRDMFLSPKSKDVILYTGIWHDSENCYLVGNPDGLKKTQDKGNVIRRFNIVAGDPALLDKGFLLDTMAVKFVRKNRYTVHPYFFHLIDLYVSNILQLTPAPTLE